MCNLPAFQATRAATLLLRRRLAVLRSVRRRISLLRVRAGRRIALRRVSGRRIALRRISILRITFRRITYNKNNHQNPKSAQIYNHAQQNPPIHQQITNTLRRRNSNRRLSLIIITHLAILGFLFKSTTDHQSASSSTTMAGTIPRTETTTQKSKTEEQSMEKPAEFYEEQRRSRI